jgi:hypothetical protein
MLGWHGEKRMWSIKKMDMNDALNTTVKRVIELINNPTVA